jgi:hypothetical protein
VEQLEDALLLPTLPFSASEMRSALCEDEGDLLVSGGKKNNNNNVTSQLEA